MTLLESIALIWSMRYSMKSMAGPGSRPPIEWLDFEGWRSSRWGKKGTFEFQNGMSGLPPKEDGTRARKIISPPTTLRGPQLAKRTRPAARGFAGSYFQDRPRPRFRSAGEGTCLFEALPLSMPPATSAAPWSWSRMISADLGSVGPDGFPRTPWRIECQRLSEIN